MWLSVAATLVGAIITTQPDHVRLGGKFFERSSSTPPPSLVEWYGRFICSLPDGKRIAPIVLPGTVEVSSDPRPLISREYGNNINTQFMANGYSPYVLFLSKLANHTYRIRTSTSEFYVVKTASDNWCIYRYEDCPIR